MLYADFNSGMSRERAVEIAQQSIFVKKGAVSRAFTY